MIEFRYYITTAVAFVALQFLLWCFIRTCVWLFNLSPRPRTWLFGGSYLILNGLLLVHILHFVALFRPLALLLVLLLLAFFVSATTWATYQIGKRFVAAEKWQRPLRFAYPIAFWALIGVAVYNAYTPKIVHYTITIDKPLSPLRIGVASDLHLGKLFGGKQLDRLAQIFQQQQVDLILLPGDIMDDNLTAYHAEAMRPHLEKLRAPLGVYATLGNHDFFGHQQSIANELQSAGIHVLWDQAVVLNDQFAIVGRNDDLNKQRPSAAQLLSSLDTRLPIFLMDHRPTEIEQHSRLPIDLQVSGHTHNGQIFPANLITQAIYRLSYGYEKIGLGHYVVTSGYSFWGVPMRLGSQSEVVIVDIRGK